MTEPRRHRGRAWLSAVLIATATLIPAALQARDYPARPVRFIVPFPPGGGSDVMARLLSDRLQQALGQPFVVENRPGASGNVGLELAARSAPNGYTIVINPNSIAITPALFGSPLDPLRDFTPVVMVSQAPIVIGGYPGLPVRTIGDLVNYAKANPGKLSYASCGNGGLQQIAMELLKQASRIDIAHVPYTGCGQPIPDMLSGRVDFYGSVMNSVAAYLQTGELRAYAIANSARSSLLPEVPTISESGYPGVVVDNWVGIFAPAGVPQEVVTQLNGAVGHILARDDIQEKMRAQFLEPVGGTPARLADALKTDVPRYAMILKDLGIEKPD
ncbi:MAG: tripartite tricarboxylate transporter substrate binding protein [Alphaproteobacteria bacterium]|nr:tripartite tricarboxylate transporter substrate binding protein [Alphaproteobacteria bacterium]